MVWIGEIGGTDYSRARRCLIRFSLDFDLLAAKDAIPASRLSVAGGAVLGIELLGFGQRIWRGVGLPDKCDRIPELLVGVGCHIGIIAQILPGFFGAVGAVVVGDWYADRSSDKSAPLWADGLPTGITCAS